MHFTTIFYALIVGIVPSFVWLAFWLHEDVKHPEPKWLIATSFCGGAVVVLLSIFVEKFIVEVVSDQSIRYMLWATTEEILKLVVVAIIAFRTSYYDEPIDAMIYLVTIALGFTAIENTLFISSSFLSGDVSAAIAMEGTRFVGATLVHVVCSAIIGFSIGFTYYRHKVSKVLALIIGIVTAVALHSLFNLTIISASPNEMMQIFAWVWLSVVILIILFEEVKAVKPKIAV